MHNLELDGIHIPIIKKNIKNINLTITAPKGDVRVSAPYSLTLERIEHYLKSKLGWIKKQRAHFQQREQYPPDENNDSKPVQHLHLVEVNRIEIEAFTEQIAALIQHWEKIMSVSVAKFSIRRMKTRWGSCTPSSRTIRINLALAKKSHACLEYVVVHELVHLLEPSHNKRFKQLMDRYLPTWRSIQIELNQK